MCLAQGHNPVTLVARKNDLSHEKKEGFLQ